MLPASDQVPIPENAETLARAYVDELARTEGVTIRPMLRRTGADDIAGFLDELEGAPDRDAPSLRADLAATAVLLARAVAAEPGLAGRLRRGDGPVVTIQTFTPDFVDLVKDVVKQCATAESSSKKLIVSRDGSEKTGQNAGSADVTRALHSRWPVVGIAPDPKRQLPNAVLRMTEYWIAMPPLDEWTTRLVIEAVTGLPYAGAIDGELVRLADLTDLNLALRRDLSPEACLERLSQIVKNKNTYHGDGPPLEELDGYGEAKVWGLELISDLQDYRRGTLAWDQLDHKGLLVSGPPGTGKTSFAKALAKSAGVPLIATSVADWNAASYLSGTLQAIRNVFAQASRQAPSILFIDEIDGISSRSNLRGDYVEYWTQIVNLLLECLAGVEDRPGVVVIAATNHPEKIDAAVLRAGRLDHHIQIQKPDVPTLEKIFRHHLGSDLLQGVDLLPAGLAARGGTGADVEAWVRRAKAAARRSRRHVELDDVLQQIRAGKPQMSSEARKRIAVHEAGHVVAIEVLATGELVGVSLLDHGGITEVDAAFDGTATPAQLQDQIVVALAGRAAEQLLLGNFSIGAGNGADSDLSKATQTAELLETQYGAGIFGPLYFGDTMLDNLPRYPGLLEAVKARVETAMAKAAEILGARVDVLRRLATELDMRGVLAASDVHSILHEPAKLPSKEAAE